MKKTRQGNAPHRHVFFAFDKLLRGFAKLSTDKKPSLGLGETGEPFLCQQLVNALNPETASLTQYPFLQALNQQWISKNPTDPTSEYVETSRSYQREASTGFFEGQTR